jgi:methyl-accepting chemotaxis protein
MQVEASASLPSAPVFRPKSLPSWASLTVGAKVFAAFAVIIGLMVFVAGLAFVRLEQTTQVYEDIVQDTIVTFQKSESAKGALDRFVRAFRGLATMGDERQYEPAFSQNRGQLREAVQAWQAVSEVSEVQRELAQILTLEARYAELGSRAQVLVRSGRLEQASDLFDQEARPVDKEIEALLYTTADQELKHGEARRAQAAAQVADTRRLLVVAVILAAILAIGLATGITRTITSRLSEFLFFVSHVAQGDLTGRVAVKGGDELGALGSNLNLMTAGLHELASTIREAVTEISAGTAEILAAASQQAAGASEQSAAIAQTTATVEEVRTSAEQAAETADRGSVANDARSKAAQEAVDAVKEAVQGMSDIRQRVGSIAEHILSLSEQTQQIGEIISSVNDLADQSNLLALNAAIEASRAGEHGKGFAVVASEIRNLAEQSKEATGQIKTILSDIQAATNAAVMATEQGTKGVDVGTGLIDRAGETISALAEGIELSRNRGQQIAASIRQTSIGTDQIAIAMASINQATAENLAATADTKKAAESLDQVGHHLSELVTQYKL